MSTMIQQWVFIVIKAVQCVYSLDFTVVDLTHELNSSTIYWPGMPTFNFTILKRENLTKDIW